MKTKLFAIVVAMTMCAVFIPVVGAGSTDYIDVTLTPGGSATIAVNQSSWDGEGAALGAWGNTSFTWAKCENDGTISVSVEINGSNTEDWTISDTANGNNQFLMQYGLTDTWYGFDADKEVFDASIAYNEETAFGLSVHMPSSSGSNDAQHFRVTFTATAL